MSATIPTFEPGEITQARTVKWTKSLSDYPAGDGSALAYNIINGSTTYALEWGTHVTADGDGFAITLPATLITGLTAGVNARLNGFVTLDGEVFDIYDGALRIKVAGELSFARTALAAVEAMLAGNASREERELEVTGGGVSQRIGMCDKRELMALHVYYRTLVENETAGEASAQGRGTGRIIRTRYRQPS